MSEIFNYIISNSNDKFWKKKLKYMEKLINRQFPYKENINQDPEILKLLTIIREKYSPLLNKLLFTDGTVRTSLPEISDFFEEKNPKYNFKDLMESLDFIFDESAYMLDQLFKNSDTYLRDENLIYTSFPQYSDKDKMVNMLDGERVMFFNYLKATPYFDDNKDLFEGDIDESIIFEIITDSRLKLFVLENKDGQKYYLLPRNLIFEIEDKRKMNEKFIITLKYIGKLGLPHKKQKIQERIILETNKLDKLFLETRKVNRRIPDLKDLFFQDENFKFKDIYSKYIRSIGENINISEEIKNFIYSNKNNRNFNLFQNLWIEVPEISYETLSLFLTSDEIAVGNLVNLNMLSKKFIKEYNIIKNFINEEIKNDGIKLNNDIILFRPVFIPEESKFFKELKIGKFYTFKNNINAFTSSELVLDMYENNIDKVRILRLNIPKNNLKAIISPEPFLVKGHDKKETLLELFLDKGLQFQVKNIFFTEITSFIKRNKYEIEVIDMDFVERKTNTKDVVYKFSFDYKVLKNIIKE